MTSMTISTVLCVLALAGGLRCCFGQGYGSYRDSGYRGQSSGPVAQARNVCNPATTKLTFPTPNEGCFPNILKNPVQVDPLSRQGLYFEYRSRFSPEQSYNAQVVNSLVCDGLVFFPGTYTPAVHWTQTYRFITFSQEYTYDGTSPAHGSGYGYQSGHGQKATCHNQFYDSISGYNGVDFYNSFDPELGNAQPVQQVFYLMFVKPGPRGFEIQYSCDVRNEETYICEKVSVFVNCRVHPNQLTPEENYEIDATIDRVLATYCMSKNDLQKVIHRDDLSVEQCNLAPLNAFISLVNGYAASLPKRAPSDRRY
ncbi:hypothetical protein RvY_03983 [Ramazzottius varieornatus]|uniref:ZP domain-containing protein n=1 Tax=Ramazzottius varieornatus TaxID=947166 RepID=A0A1D1UZA1_RAMVA|nr:hypothetical protein RvY_03983 [Ramazzottius varieornatus]